MKHKRIHTHGRRVLALLLAAILTVCTGAAAAAADDAHVHVAGESTIENVIPPTCASMGAYDDVIRCRLCNAIMSSEHVLVAKTITHVAGDPVKENVIPGSCMQQGSYDTVVY